MVYVVCMVWWYGTGMVPYHTIWDPSKVRQSSYDKQKPPQQIILQKIPPTPSAQPKFLNLRNTRQFGFFGDGCFLGIVGAVFGAKFGGFSRIRFLGSLASPHEKQT